MTKQQAATLFHILNAAFPLDVIEPASAELLIANLIPLDYETAKAVIRDHIATERRFPTFAELRQPYAVRMRRQRESNEGMRAIESLTSGKREMPDEVVEWAERRGWLEAEA